MTISMHLPEAEKRKSKKLLQPLKENFQLILHRFEIILMFNARFFVRPLETVSLLVLNSGLDLLKRIINQRFTDLTTLTLFSKLLISGLIAQTG